MELINIKERPIDNYGNELCNEFSVEINLCNLLKDLNIDSKSTYGFTVGSIKDGKVVLSFLVDKDE